MAEGEAADRLGGADPGRGRSGRGHVVSSAGLGPLLLAAPVGLGAARRGSRRHGAGIDLSWRPPLDALRGADECVNSSDGRSPGSSSILLGSYAFFWHSRDWNIASRLMLTYALVDRGTVSIDGLEDQTQRHGVFPRSLLLGQAAGLLAPGDRSLLPWRRLVFAAAAASLGGRGRASPTGRPITG